MRIPVPIYFREFNDNKSVRFQKSRLILFVLDNPLCTFPQIHKKSMINKKWKYLKKYHSELVQSGCITELFNKQCFVRPLPYRYQAHVEFLERWDKIVSIINSNQILSNSDFAKNLQKFYEDKLNAPKSKIKKSLMKYEYGYNFEKPINEQILAKIFQVLFINLKILDHAMRKLSWDTKSRVTSSTKINLYLKDMKPLLYTIELFLSDFDKPKSLMKKYYKLGKILDSRYETAEKYLNMHNHHQKSLEYRMEIWRKTKTMTMGAIAKELGISSRQVKNIINSITTHKKRKVETSSYSAIISEERLSKSKIHDLKNIENYSNLLN